MRYSVTLSLMLAASAPALVDAQTYPAKPIRIIVSYPAGGANDIVARTVGQKLNEMLGANIVVDNRSGAGGTIGADIAAKAPPDGYTLLMAAGAHTLAPSLYTKLPYDIVRDFAPVSISAKSTYLLVIHPSVPAASVRERARSRVTRDRTAAYPSRPAVRPLRRHGP